MVSNAWLLMTHKYKNIVIIDSASLLPLLSETILLMSYHTAIEWTDSTWNPIVGCSKVSPGCKNCYAEALIRRFAGVKGHPFEQGFQVRLRPEKLLEPGSWKTPRRIFTCSMSDLFHEQVPLDFILQVFHVMASEERHTFQVLTKRAERLKELSPLLHWTPNIWIGVSVESEAQADRINSLRVVPAPVRFISFEPLLGPFVSLDLHDIDWVIVGGESGVRARKMEIEWATGIRDQCLASRIPFFFKQFGGRRGKEGGAVAILDGIVWHEFPQPNHNRI